MADIAGFWSYVHADNESVGGAIVKLAERVMSEFELLSAEPLRLFVDRDLEWGDEWKERIDHELQQTTFFIPVITPRYFLSEECRRELVRFRSAADRFNVKQLLLPIYYVTVPEMHEREPQDELVAVVRATQREDMRKVRLAEEWDAVHRNLVNQLASKLLTISRETEGLSTPPDDEGDGRGLASPFPDVPPTTGTAFESPPAVTEPEAQLTADGGDGDLDVLAMGEEALLAWTETMREFGEEIRKVGNAVEVVAPEMAAAESFSARLRVANELAIQLDEPAESITRIAQDYSTHLIKVDPAIQTLIEGMRINSDEKDAAEAKELFTSILEMVHVSREGAAGIGQLIATMEGPASQSRELRARLRTIQTALRNIADGQKVLDDWERQIRDLYGDSLDTEEGAE